MNVFLFNPYESHEQHTIVDLADKTARELISNGDAVEISLGEYNEYHQKAKIAYDAFKSRESQIKDSKNPYYHIPDVQEYELRKNWEEFESTSKSLEEDWMKYRRQQIEDAKVRAARAYVAVSERDKSTAEQAANRYSMELAMANNPHTIRKVYDDIYEDLKRMTDEQKTAMQGYIGNVMTTLGQKIESVQWGTRMKKPEMNDVYAKLQDIRNMDLLGVKAAESLPLRVADDYKTILTVKHGKFKKY